MTNAPYTCGRPPLDRHPRQAFPWALLSVLCLFPASPLAQPGAPASQGPSASCIASDRYSVDIRPGNGPGYDIVARPIATPRAPGTCDPSQTPADFRVASAGEAKNVLGLRGTYLVLDEGTGPSIRRLLIIDLAKGGEVWSGQYVPEPKPALTPKGVVFRQFLRIARKNDCRNARKIILQGFTPLYVRMGELSLSALAFTATGQPDCIAGQ